MGLSDEQHSSLQVLHAERHLEVQQLRGQEVDFRLTHTEICSIERKMRFIHIFDKRIKNSKGLCKVKKKRRRNKMIRQESFNINIKKLVSDEMDQAAMLFFLYLCFCLLFYYFGARMAHIWEICWRANLPAKNYWQNRSSIR